MSYLYYYLKHFTFPGYRLKLYYPPQVAGSSGLDEPASRSVGRGNTKVCYNRRGRMPAKKERIYTLDEMIEMRRRGVTLRDLAKQLGITYQRVQQILGPTRAIIPHRYYPTREERKAARIARRTAAFWSHVSITEPDKCWEWQGLINPTTGYGRFTFNGKHISAHRCAYELSNGEIPDGKIILHECDNRKCCNPAHLRAGTPQENIKDRDTRGRHKSRIGCNAYYRQRNKEIVEQYGGSLDEIPMLAQKFGVGGQVIYSVIRRARRESEVSNV